MTETNDLCDQCVQILTNPICPYCFTQHVLYWLRDKNLPNKKMLKIMRELAEVVKDSQESHANTKCIMCGTGKVNLCTYCFTNKATRILENNIEDDQQLDEFKEDFETIIWRI